MSETIRSVAVIGAGVSGLTAAKHLQSRGLEVVVFERTSRVGGNWAYDEKLPPEPKFPSIIPSIADFVLDSDPKTPLNDTNDHSQETVDKIKLEHSPPGPAYDGLTTNVSTVLQELKDYPWKDGVGDFVNVRVAGDYLEGFSDTFNLTPIIRFDTRVENLEKKDKKWQLKSSTLKIDESGIVQKSNTTEEYDAVVVASGHYHASRVPDIPGLKEWKAAWPSLVQHSKQYRKPDDFRGQNVLLIGSGVSSTDIAREISPISGNVYQTHRGSAWDLPLSFLPPKTTRIAEIVSFDQPSSPNDNIRSLSVTLKDGTQLKDIDRVVVCTGYHISYPFLSHLHQDFVAAENADETVLVTDGTMVHNLHKDIFYIPDPSLAFVGTSYYTATFTLFEFQSVAVAAVFAGKALLPSREAQREEYVAKLKAKGLGRSFHSLKDEQKEYVDELVAWINEDAKKTGGETVTGHTERWLEEYKVFREKMKKLFSATPEKLVDGEKPLEEPIEPWTEEKSVEKKPSTVLAFFRWVKNALS